MLTRIWGKISSLSDVIKTDTTTKNIRVEFPQEARMDLSHNLLYYF